MLLNRRLGEIAGRMERLMGRFMAGTLRQAASRVAPSVSAEGGAAVRPARIWPSDFGWLLRLKAHHAALYHHRLVIVLAQPDMVALLAACPQAARIMLPMCRMLGVATSLLTPGIVAEPAAVKAVAVRKKRIRRKLPPIDWGRIPLPRGVLSAARRAGFKPVR